MSRFSLLVLALILVSVLPSGVSGQVATRSVLDRLATADQLAVAGEPERAMGLYEELLAQGANERARAGEVRSAVAMSLAAKRAGDQEEALRPLLRARKYVPDDPTLLYDFGVQAEQMKLYRDSEVALTEALRLRPGEAKTMYALGRVKMDRDDLLEGERLFRLYLAKRPEDATAHYGLGLAEHRGLHDDEAVAEFHRSLQLQPLQTESQYQLGMIALSRSDLVEARRQFEAILARAPQHGGALTGLGQIEIREKNFSEAREHLQSAVRVAPDYAEAHRYLALALGKTGDAAGSQAELETADRLTAQQNQARKGLTLQP